MTPFRFPAARLLGGTFLLAASGLLVGCGDGDTAQKTTSNDGGGSATAAAGNEGVITIDDVTYTFTTDVCMSSDGETLISGPGKDADGAPVYVDLDAFSPTEGELTIDLGSDEKFNSVDESLGSRELSIETDGSRVTVEAAFVDTTSGASVGAGTLEVACS